MPGLLTFFQTLPEKLGKAPLIIIPALIFFAMAYDKTPSEPRQPDEFDDAFKVCNSFQKMQGVTDCQFKAPRTLAVTVPLGTNMAEICKGSATAISQATTNMHGKGWQLELWTPYSRTAVYRCSI